MVTESSLTLVLRHGDIIWSWTTLTFKQKAKQLVFTYAILLHKRLILLSKQAVHAEPTDARMHDTASVTAATAVYQMRDCT